MQDEGGGGGSSDVGERGEASGPGERSCALKGAGGELYEFSEEAVGQGDPGDENAEFRTQREVRVERGREEKQNKASHRDRQRMTPGVRKGSPVAADVADEDHFHAEGAELAEGSDQGRDPDKGAVFVAAQRTSDEDEVDGLGSHGDALAGDHPERALAERFFGHGAAATEALRCRGLRGGQSASPG
jgi:hypothetical protein